MFCELVSGIFISNTKNALNETYYKQYKIDIVINCTLQESFIHLPHVKKIRLPVSYDMLYETDIHLIRSMYPKVNKILKDNFLHHNILIYCYDGIKISPLIVAIFLMKEGSILKTDIHNIFSSKHKGLCIDYDLSLF